MSDAWDDLLLVRLACAPNAETAASIARAFAADVPATGAPDPTGEFVALRLRELVSAGLVEARGPKSAATAAGRERAAAWLGVPAGSLPANWPAARDTHLVARALGLEPDARTLERLGRTDGLTAEIVRQAFSLETGPAPSMSELKTALGWHLLTRGARAEVVSRVSSGPFSGGAALAALVYAELGAAGKPDAAKGLGLLAARALGARPDAKSLRGALIARLVRSGAAPAASMPPAASGATAIEEFAAAALAAARDSATGRFGKSRVFVSHAWRKYAADNPRGASGLDEFKSRLVEANRRGLLALARADLVPAMNPADVEGSRIEYLTATFHFIRI